VFAAANGKPHAQSNVRRTMTNVVARANERLEEAGQAPLPRLSPHALRRTWASVMFALGESIPIVIAEGGWAAPKGGADRLRPRHTPRRRGKRGAAGAR
jgi:integrase